MKTEMFVTCFMLVVLLATSDAGEPCDSPQYIVEEETGTIQCNFSAGFFGIFWYNTTDYINEYSLLNLKESSGISGPGYTSGEFGIHPNGSLIITEVNLAHNRNFTVVKLDHAFQEVVPHFVTVVVQAFPDPPYPIIEGCQQQRPCAMKVAHQGKLKCSVLGIHPRMDLAWKVIRNKSSINLLHTRQNGTKRADGRFDVHLVSEFYISNTSEYSQTVECFVVSTEGAPTFDLVSKVLLLFPEATKSPIKTTDKVDVTDGGLNGFIVFLIVFIVLVIVAVISVGAFFMIRRAKTAKYPSPGEADDVMSEEGLPLTMSTKSTGSNELDELIKQLQKRYRQFYDATQPIPHIRSKNKTRGKVFIESDLQSLNFREGVGKYGIWESVKSVETVLKEPGFGSKKLILEGDHGYMKSTLGIELAYDWCTEDQSSFTKEFEVLIYLKLNQLSNTTPTFSSLSRMLLGKDCKIGDKDIKELLACSSRVGVLIDGFSYDPIGEQSGSLDLVKLISSSIFKPLTVILISAPPLLENIYHSGDIKRLRVSGIDKQTRHELFTTTVATNTQESVKRGTAGQNESGSFVNGIPEKEESGSVVSDSAMKTESELVERDTKPKGDGNSVDSGSAAKEESNPSEEDSTQKKGSLVLFDLLETPLFFSILLQISQKNDARVNHESITKFFFGMIRNLELETNDESRTEVLVDDNLTKPNQQILHKIAFDSITFNKKQTKFWNKEKISKQMGGNFYESCKLKGYFIEEGFEYNNESGLDVSKFEIKVRFSNTFFCEWFAAHHIHHMNESLSSKKDKKDVEDSIIKLVSNDYWYCLRFLCGLSKELAEKVMRAAKGREGMHFFCALEKKGHSGIDNTQDAVKKIVSKDVYIKFKESKLEQMSIIQLLQTSSKNQVPIQHLFLEDCFNGPSSSSSELILRSGLELPILDTLVEFDLIEEGRTLTEPEAEAIFRYSLHCNNLKHMRFCKCLLPHTVSGKGVSNDTDVKNLEVKWKSQSNLGSFLFDFESRKWKKKDGMLITDEEYNGVVKDFHNLI